jgi:hypothetical protein
MWYFVMIFMTAVQLGPFESPEQCEGLRKWLDTERGGHGAVLSECWRGQYEPLRIPAPTHKRPA